jgi:hypothetical protein
MNDKFAKMQERRLHGNVQKAGKDTVANESKRLATLEKARDNLAIALESYIKLLTDKTLPENRSESDRQQQANVLKLLPPLAEELNMRNVSEGTNSLLTTCLNSILVLRDRVNHLHFQNLYLNKQIQELKQGPMTPPETTKD